MDGRRHIRSRFSNAIAITLVLCAISMFVVSVNFLQKGLPGSFKFLVGFFMCWCSVWLIYSVIAKLILKTMKERKNISAMPTSSLDKDNVSVRQFSLNTLIILQISICGFVGMNLIIWQNPGYRDVFWSNGVFVIADFSVLIGLWQLFDKWFWGNGVKKKDNSDEKPRSNNLLYRLGKTFGRSFHSRRNPYKKEETKK